MSTVDLLGATTRAVVILLISAFGPAVHASETLRPPSPGTDWTQIRGDRDLVIFYRDVSNANAREILAITNIAAPPRVIFGIVTDFENYPRFMPYTRDARILKQWDESKVLVYTLTAPPLIAPRDLLEEVTLIRGNPGNGGVFQSHWIARPDLEPARPGVVRLRLSTGSWLLEPTDDGRGTRVTYSVLSDPGGSIPLALANLFTSNGIEGVLNAVRKRVSDQHLSGRETTLSRDSK